MQMPRPTANDLGMQTENLNSGRIALTDADPRTQLGNCSCLEQSSAWVPESTWGTWARVPRRIKWPVDNLCSWWTKGKENQGATGGTVRFPKAPESGLQEKSSVICRVSPEKRIHFRSPGMR